MCFLVFPQIINNYEENTTDLCCGEGFIICSISRLSSREIPEEQKTNINLSVCMVSNLNLKFVKCALFPWYVFLNFNKDTSNISC